MLFVALVLLLLNLIQADSLLAGGRRHTSSISTSGLKGNPFPGQFDTNRSSLSPPRTRHLQLIILNFKEPGVVAWDEEDGEDRHSNSAQLGSMRQRYKILRLVYAGLAATLFLMPDRTLTKKLATKLGGAAGFGVAAFIAWMLSDASAQGKLSHATNKRLSTGLLGFSILGVPSVPGEAAFFTTAGPAIVLSAIMTVARIGGAIVAYSGWSICVMAQQSSGRIPLMGPRKLLNEITDGITTTFKSLKVRKENRKRSLTYRNCLLLVSASMLSSLAEGIFYIRVSS